MSGFVPSCSTHRVVALIGRRLWAWRRQLARLVLSLDGYAVVAVRVVPR